MMLLSAVMGLLLLMKHYPQHICSWWVWCRWWWWNGNIIIYYGYGRAPVAGISFAITLTTHPRRCVDGSIYLLYYCHEQLEPNYTNNKDTMPHTPGSNTLHDMYYTRHSAKYSLCLIWTRFVHVARSYSTDALTIYAQLSFHTVLTPSLSVSRFKIVFILVLLLIC